MSQLSYDVSDDFLKGSVTDALGTVTLDLEIAYNDTDGKQVFIYRSNDGRRAFGVDIDPATGERSLKCEKSEARLIRELKAALMRTSRHAPDNLIYLSPRMCAAGYFHQEAPGTTAFFAVKEIGRPIYCATVSIGYDDESPSGLSYACDVFFPGESGAWDRRHAGATWRSADLDAALRDFADSLRPERDRGSLVFYAEIGPDAFRDIVAGEERDRDSAIARIESVFPPENEMRRLAKEHDRKKRAEVAEVTGGGSIGRSARRLLDGFAGRGGR